MSTASPSVGLFARISVHLARLAVGRPGAVLLVACLVTATSGLALRHLRVRANLVALLPTSLPHVRNLDRVIEKTGGFGDVVVLAETRGAGAAGVTMGQESQGPGAPGGGVEAPGGGLEAPGGGLEAAARVLEDLVPAVRALPWTRSADYQVDTEALKPFAALYMDRVDLEAIRERLQRRLEHAVGASLDLGDSPPSVDFSDITKKYDDRAKGRKSERMFRSEDGRLVALLVIPQGGVTSDLAFGRRILEDVQRLVDARSALAAREGVTLTVAGKFWNRLKDYEAVIRDVRRSAIWGGLLILVLITAYFRHALAVPLILVPLGMSLCWTFAITQLVIGHLNVITAFLFIILLGLGIDFGIHLFARYRNERRAGQAQEPALQRTICFTGRACLTSGLTTSAAFAALMVTDFKGFSQFGFIAALGILLAFIAMILVMPSLMVLAERIRLLRWPTPSAPPSLLPSPSPAQGRHPAGRLMGLGALLGLGVATAGAICASSGRIPFEYDFNKLNTQPAEVNRIKEKTRRVFKHSTDSAVVFVEDLQEAEALHASVRRHMEGDRSPTIKGVRSLLSLKDALPKDQEAKLAVLKDIKDLLGKRAIRNALEDLEPEQRQRFLDFEKQAQARLVTLEDLPDQLRRPFFGLPGVSGTMVFIENLRPMKDAREAAAFVKDTRSFKTERQTYYPASEAVVYAETISLLQRDGVIAILASLATVLLLLLLDFRHLGRTLIVFLPLAAAVGWLLLVMAAWPISLNMYNLVVLPSIIGLGIDHSVHLYHRVMELGPGRVREAMVSILGPITATTITTMVGFGGMISAHQAGLQSIGILAVLGMALCWLGVVVLLPALLIWNDDRRARGRSDLAQGPSAPGVE